MTRTEMIESLKKENPEMEIKVFDYDGEELFDTTVEEELAIAEGLDDEAFGEVTYQEIVPEYVLYAVEQENRLGGGKLLTNAIRTKKEALKQAKSHLAGLTDLEKKSNKINVNSYRTSVPFEAFDFDNDAWDWEESEEIEDV